MRRNLRTHHTGAQHGDFTNIKATHTLLLELILACGSSISRSGVNAKDRR
jgi:hypothetical protein